ncbi:MAG TPA: hypothetical protein VF422_05540 [Dokdonella sp.]
MILEVPRDELGAVWPSLGGQVVQFMHENLVFGPGDRLGEPLELDEERQYFLWRFYEVYPKGHARAGRRRHQRCVLSLAKGSAKTEFAALIAACELHPEAPVRCVGWTESGDPIGGGVVDPYIPMVAVNEGQSDRLAYGALKAILEHENCPLRHDFDIGLERIERKHGRGVAESLSNSPGPLDGARTTFAINDETHLWVLARMKQAHTVMQANLSKRLAADSWGLETTTAPEPGGGSVAEAAMDYARDVQAGRSRGHGFYYFHRQASEHHDLSTPEGALAALTEAAGPSAAWRDLPKTVEQLDNPNADRAWWARTQCNMLVKGSTQAFDVLLWDSLAVKRDPPAPKTKITLGFDGGQFHDGTGLVGTEIETGYQFVLGAWECPPGGEKLDPPWQVPTTEVDALVRDTFNRYDVWRLYADPPYWQSWISNWIGEFGEERVIEWWTNRRRQMSAALESFTTAMRAKTISHDGDARLRRHIGNSRRFDIPGWKDEQGKSIWLIQKDRPDSPQKIDLAMCAAISNEARNDAIADGVLKKKETVVSFASVR